ncbi:phage major capsid protein [Gammaproteobacteria bacterium]|nr:phage major capsid protein [Gammaproteobacteria bacterium]
MNRYLKLDLSRAEGNVIPAVISTDTPVDRGGYMEVLDHTREAIQIRSGDSLPLLTAHDSSEPAIGKVKDLKISDGKLRGSMVFGSSQRARELLDDIKERLIDGVSIGYRILEKELDGDTLFARKWEIFEASVVGVPADVQTGFYRSKNKEIIMETENSVETINAERKRCSEIAEIGKRFNHEEDANKAIESGESLDSFRSKVLDAVETKTVATPFVKDVGDSHREYSLIDAIEGLHDVSKRGVEFEISQDLARSQKRTKGDSILVPLDTRVMTGATAGASTIQTTVDNRIQDFIQAKSIGMNLGAQVFRLDSDDLMIPKGSSNSGASIQATESTQTAESTPTLSNTTLTPKYITNVIPLSYKFLQQSSPDVENYLRNLIGESFASVMDDQMIAGSGSSGNMQGLFNSSIGTTAISAGAPTYAKLLDSIETVAGANVDISNLRWIMDPGTLKNLATAVKFSSTDSPLIDLSGSQDAGNVIGSMVGYPVHMSSNMQDNKFIVGDFSKSAWAFWGGLEISLDQFYDTRRYYSALQAIMSADFKVIDATAFNILTA